MLTQVLDPRGNRGELASRKRLQPLFDLRVQFDGEVTSQMMSFLGRGIKFFTFRFSKRPVS